MDGENYMGHVFAGVAALELGRHAEAKGHYKTAIAAQPQEALAWKVHLYDIPRSFQISNTRLYMYILIVFTYIK